MRQGDGLIASLFMKMEMRQGDGLIASFFMKMEISDIDKLENYVYKYSRKIKRVRRYE